MRLFVCLPEHFFFGEFFSCHIPGFFLTIPTTTQRFEDFLDRVSISSDVGVTIAVFII